MSPTCRSLTFVLLALLSAARLGAHVEVFPKSATAGEFAYLDFVVTHGCRSAATSKVTIKVPDGVVLVRPQVKPGWQIEGVNGKYAAPIQAGGETLTEGFVEVSWSGGSVPALHAESFPLVAQLPFRPGEPLVFLARQSCDGVDQPLDFTPTVDLVDSTPAEKPEPGASPALAWTGVALGGLGLLAALGTLARRGR